MDERKGCVVSGTYTHAPGFYAGDRPRIVTSRFEYADSHTIERYLATDGYKGLRASLARPAADVHEEVKNATVLGRGGAGFPAGTKWGLMPAGSFPVISWSMVTRANPARTRTACSWSAIHTS